MKSFKKVALTLMTVVMMLLMSTSVFAADSPTKTSFNASMTKTSSVYNGKKQNLKNLVVVTKANGKKIPAKYYNVKVNKTCKNAGKYTVTITGKGKYAGYVQKLTYTVKAKTQKVTVKKDSYTTTAAKVKKRVKSFNPGVTFKKGTATYTTNNTNIKVGKNGKIYVAKGTKKGTYQVKVTVKAKNYKKVTKYIKVTVK